MKKHVVTKTKKVVTKGKAEDKIAQVLGEFKDGKLKRPDGKIVTNKEEAVAIALNMAGVARKDLARWELLNKIRVQKARLNTLIQKELAKDSSIEDRIINFLTESPYPEDAALHAFAEKMNIPPDEVEKKVYAILSDILTGGKSKGKKADVDPEELKKGIAIEQEHTSNLRIAEKIATDHLVEIPDYYTRLAKMEAEAKGSSNVTKARTVGGYESPEPGNLPEAGAKLLADVYAKCRADGGDKGKCSKIAWGAVNNAGYK